MTTAMKEHVKQLSLLNFHALFHACDLDNMSQSASDWERLRSGTGSGVGQAKSCNKRPRTRSRLAADAEEEPSEQLDWLPGAALETLAETYVSYMIAILCCVSLPRQEGAARFECQGVPAFVHS